MRISKTHENMLALQELLGREGPDNQTTASAQEVLSVAGKLWLAVATAHRSPPKWRIEKAKKTVVRLGWEFHSDTDFSKWATIRTCPTTLRCWVRLYSPTSSGRRFVNTFQTLFVVRRGGTAPSLRFSGDALYIVNHLPPSRGGTRETCAISIYMLELCNEFMAAFVVQGIVGARPKHTRDAMLMRGDTTSAASWVNRYGESRDRRTGLTMGLSACIENAFGWCHVAKHIPGAENEFAHDNIQIARGTSTGACNSNNPRRKLGPN